MLKFYLLSDEITGVFSFLNPVVEFLKELDQFGLAIYTLFEVLLIIPPIEVIYYPLLVLNMDTWYLYLLNITIMNVLASALGYYVGSKIGYPILRYFTSEKTLDKAKALFDRWGILAVALGAFTPVPYTIVVFLGGISKMDFKKFILAGLLGRFPRYFIGGYVLVYVLEEFDSAVLNQYTLIASIFGMLLFILYYIIQGIINLYKRRSVSEQ